MKLGKVAKAVVAALVAAGGTLAAVSADGVISLSEAFNVVLTVLGALGVTWAVPNKQDSPSA